MIQKKGRGALYVRGRTQGWQYICMYIYVCMCEYLSENCPSMGYIYKNQFKNLVTHYIASSTQKTEPVTKLEQIKHAKHKMALE